MDEKRLLLCNLIRKLDKFTNVRIEALNCSVPLYFEGPLRKYYEFNYYGTFVDSVVKSIYVDERDYLCIGVIVPHFVG